jgi:hypothetical protein
MLILLAGEVQLGRQTPVGKDFLSARRASSGRIFSPEKRGSARLVLINPPKLYSGKWVVAADLGVSGQPTPLCGDLAHDVTESGIALRAAAGRPPATRVEAGACVQRQPDRSASSRLVAPVQVVSTVLTHTAHLSPSEAEMCTTIGTFAGLLTLAAVSVQAAPLPPTKAILVELGTAPPNHRTKGAGGKCGAAREQYRPADHGRRAALDRRSAADRLRR